MQYQERDTAVTGASSVGVSLAVSSITAASNGDANSPQLASTIVSRPSLRDSAATADATIRGLRTNVMFDGVGDIASAATAASRVTQIPDLSATTQGVSGLSTIAVPTSGCPSVLLSDGISHTAGVATSEPTAPLTDNFAANEPHSASTGPQNHTPMMSAAAPRRGLHEVGPTPTAFSGPTLTLFDEGECAVQFRFFDLQLRTDAALTHLESLVKSGGGAARIVKGRWASVGAAPPPASLSAARAASAASWAADSTSDIVTFLHIEGAVQLPRGGPHPVRPLTPIPSSRLTEASRLHPHGISCSLSAGHTSGDAQVSFISRFADAAAAPAPPGSLHHHFLPGPDDSDADSTSSQEREPDSGDLPTDADATWHLLLPVSHMAWGFRARAVRPKPYTGLTDVKNFRSEIVWVALPPPNLWLEAEVATACDVTGRAAPSQPLVFQVKDGTEAVAAIPVGHRCLTAISFETQDTKLVRDASSLRDALIAPLRDNARGTPWLALGLHAKFREMVGRFYRVTLQRVRGERSDERMPALPPAFAECLKRTVPFQDVYLAAASQRRALRDRQSHAQSADAIDSAASRDDGASTGAVQPPLSHTELFYDPGLRAAEPSADVTASGAAEAGAVPVSPPPEVPHTAPLDDDASALPRIPDAELDVEAVDNGDASLLPCIPASADCAGSEPAVEAHLMEDCDSADASSVARAPVFAASPVAPLVQESSPAVAVPIVDADSLSTEPQSGASPSVCGSPACGSAALPAALSTVADASANSAAQPEPTSRSPSSAHDASTPGCVSFVKSFAHTSVSAERTSLSPGRPANGAGSARAESVRSTSGAPWEQTDGASPCAWTEDGQPAYGDEPLEAHSAAATRRSGNSTDADAADVGSCRASPSGTTSAAAAGGVPQGPSTPRSSRHEGSDADSAIAPSTSGGGDADGASLDAAVRVSLCQPVPSDSSFFIGAEATNADVGVPRALSQTEFTPSVPFPFDQLSSIGPPLDDAVEAAAPTSPAQTHFTPVEPIESAAQPSAMDPAEVDHLFRDIAFDAASPPEVPATSAFTRESFRTQQQSAAGRITADRGSTGAELHRLSAPGMSTVWVGNTEATSTQARNALEASRLDTASERRAHQAAPRTCDDVEACAPPRGTTASRQSGTPSRRHELTLSPMSSVWADSAVVAAPQELRNPAAISPPEERRVEVCSGLLRASTQTPRGSTADHETPLDYHGGTGSAPGSAQRASARPSTLSMRQGRMSADAPAAFAAVYPQSPGAGSVTSEPRLFTSTSARASGGDGAAPSRVARGPSTPRVSAGERDAMSAAASVGDLASVDSHSSRRSRASGGGGEPACSLYLKPAREPVAFTDDSPILGDAAVVSDIGVEGALGAAEFTDVPYPFDPLSFIVSTSPAGAAEGEIDLQSPTVGRDAYNASRAVVALPAPAVPPPVETSTILLGEAGELASPPVPRASATFPQRRALAVSPAGRESAGVLDALGSGHDCPPRTSTVAEGDISRATGRSSAASRVSFGASREDMAAPAHGSGRPPLGPCGSARSSIDAELRKSISSRLSVVGELPARSSVNSATSQRLSSEPIAAPSPLALTPDVTATSSRNGARLAADPAHTITTVMDADAPAVVHVSRNSHHESQMRDSGARAAASTNVRQPDSTGFWAAATPARDALPAMPWPRRATVLAHEDDDDDFVVFPMRPSTASSDRSRRASVVFGPHTSHQSRVAQPTAVGTPHSAPESRSAPASRLAEPRTATHEAATASRTRLPAAFAPMPPSSLTLPVLPSPERLPTTVPYGATARRVQQVAASDCRRHGDAEPAKVWTDQPQRRLRLSPTPIISQAPSHPSTPRPENLHAGGRDAAARVQQQSGAVVDTTARPRDVTARRSLKRPVASHVCDDEVDLLGFGAHDADAALAVLPPQFRQSADDAWPAPAVITPRRPPAPSVDLDDGAHAAPRAMPRVPRVVSETAPTQPTNAPRRRGGVPPIFRPVAVHPPPVRIPATVRSRTAAPARFRGAAPTHDEATTRPRPHSANAAPRRGRAHREATAAAREMLAHGFRRNSHLLHAQYDQVEPFMSLVITLLKEARKEARQERRNARPVNIYLGGSLPDRMVAASQRRDDATADAQRRRTAVDTVDGDADSTLVDDIDAAADAYYRRAPPRRDHGCRDCTQSATTRGRCNSSRGRKCASRDDEDDDDANASLGARRHPRDTGHRAARVSEREVRGNLHHKSRRIEAPDDDDICDDSSTTLEDDSSSTSVSDSPPRRQVVRRNAGRRFGAAERYQPRRSPQQHAASASRRRARSASADRARPRRSPPAGTGVRWTWTPPSPPSRAAPAPIAEIAQGAARPLRPAAPTSQKRRLAAASPPRPTPVDTVAERLLAAFEVPPAPAASVPSRAAPDANQRAAAVRSAGVTPPKGAARRAKGVSRAPSEVLETRAPHADVGTARPTALTTAALRQHANAGGLSANGVQSSALLSASQLQPPPRPHQAQPTTIAVAEPREDCHGRTTASTAAASALAHRAAITPTNTVSRLNALAAANASTTRDAPARVCQQCDASPQVHPPRAAPSNEQNHLLPAGLGQQPAPTSASARAHAAPLNVRPIANGAPAIGDLSDSMAGLFYGAGAGGHGASTSSVRVEVPPPLSHAALRVAPVISPRVSTLPAADTSQLRVHRTVVPRLALTTFSRLVPSPLGTSATTTAAPAPASLTATLTTAPVGDAPSTRAAARGAGGASGRTNTSARLGAIRRGDVTEPPARFL